MLKIVVNKISDPKCFIVSVYMVEKHMVSESGREKKKVYYPSYPNHELGMARYHNFGFGTIPECNTSYRY